MNRFDITFWKAILILAGMLIVAAEICLLLHGLLTGFSGSEAAWARLLFLVAGFLLVVLALRLKRR